MFNYYYITKKKFKPDLKKYQILIIQIQIAVLFIVLFLYNVINHQIYSSFILNKLDLFIPEEI